MKTAESVEKRMNAPRRNLIPIALAALAGIHHATALNVVTYEVYKGQMFTQTGTNSPALATGLPYFFQTVASPQQFISPLYVTNPAVTTPGSVKLPLALSVQTNQATVISNYAFNASAASSNALDATYGSGKYTLSYSGNFDGATSVVLSLSADSFPPTPIVSNLVAAQAINSASNFTLNFLARPTANSNDFTQLIIVDNASNTVFSTPAPDQLPESALIGTNGNIVIKPGYLFAGQTYTGLLVYTRLTTNDVYLFNGYPYILGGFISETTFPMQTTGGVQNNPPPAPAPTGLTNTLLTFTVTSGTGAFASGGTYQLFTSPIGTNYVLLGNAGAGFGSGGYVYTQTGTNTGTVTFTDARAGTISLQIVFGAGGADTFVLTNSTGAQQGLVATAPGYAGVNPPNLFLPGFTNGQFQAYLSGDLGVNYTIDFSTNLTAWTPLTNLNLEDLSTNVTDAAFAGNRYYRARVSSVGLAPNAITGQTFACTVSGGAAPFSTNGVFQWAASTNGNGYQILAVTGATNGAGTYTYAVSGPNTALISYTDSSTSATYNQQLVFSSTATGYFFTTNAGSAGSQSGRFSMASGPVLSFGTVIFTPDTNRGSSVFFPATGVAVSLSVTDAVGYVWSLSVPSDALLTPATLTMTPFASIDSSQSALPVISGVQLGPEGSQFCDAVTLTLTAPAALGSHATLMMGAGDGSGLYLVQTTNQAASYSTTLFHFSSAGAGDPSDQQWQDYLDKVLPQVMAAYNQALSQVQSLQRVVAQPPEPPDYELNCSGSNPAGDAQANAYAEGLFAKESAASQSLLSAARALVLLTGDQSYGDTAISAVRQLIETAGFRKVNTLLSDWNGNALKFAAVAKAAMSISRQDQLMGGPGLPDLFTQLINWLSNSVLDYYWKKLINEHDYTMTPALISVERTIALLGGTVNTAAFLQQVSSGYTFQVTMSCTDMGDMLSLSSSQNTLTISQDPDAPPGLIGISAIGEVQTTNNFTESGSYANCTLAPSKFEQGCVFELACTNETMDLFVFAEMGSLDENWSCPGGGGPSQVMTLDFSDAFYSTHGTQNITVDHDCSYYFTVQWQNMQAQPANATFTGPGQYAANDTVTFTIQVQHNPQSAPQKLTP